MRLCANCCCSPLASSCGVRGSVKAVLHARSPTVPSTHPLALGPAPRSSACRQTLQNKTMVLKAKGSLQASVCTWFK